MAPAQRARTASVLTALVAVLSTVGALASCAPDEAPAPPRASSDATGGAAAESHVHDDGHRHGPGHEASGQAGSQALVALLPRPAALPAGYSRGAHHGADPASAAPQVADECEPIARAVGVHPSVMPDDPHARTTFSKSHFGPEITVTVVDHGDPRAAAAEVAAFAAAASGCATYAQAASGPGAFAYAVGAEPLPRGVRSGEVLRLSALGEDFEGIHWDVWERAVGSRVLVVALRSARGGSSEDLAPAIRAALDLARG